MKKDIHPTYQQATVTCVCGNKFTTGTTKKELHTEICSNCHPFYTGKQKLVDTAGRVDKFKKRSEKAAAVKVRHASKREKLAKKAKKKIEKAKDK